MKNSYNPTIYSVSALNRETNALLESHFRIIWVQGEISNLSRPSSGHAYFSLKDAHSQIRCALFRLQQKQIPFPLENGQEIIIEAQVSLYEPRGDFQLIVLNVQLAGNGKLQLAFEKLKKELLEAGLFDERYKKPLPKIPKKIGIITSQTGAALQDILKVLNKRFPSIPIFIYPTTVQGETAASQICDAITLANHHNICDVLILARGGGSIEDLWPFNEKMVAKSIFNSTIPIVTGIGHQTDFTIADFVADFRAPTPSAAAESATPDAQEFLNFLTHQLQRLQKNMLSIYNHCQINLMHLTKRLQHPGQKCRERAQQLDQFENNLYRIMQFYITSNRAKISDATTTLNALNPLNVLQRGFSMTREKLSQKILTNRSDVKVGDTIITLLKEGEIESIVR